MKHHITGMYTKEKVSNIPVPRLYKSRKTSPQKFENIINNINLFIIKGLKR